MNKKVIIKLAFLASAVFLIIAGCKKVDTLTTPPDQAHFTFQEGGTFFITSPGATYKIPVGVTTVSNQDRVINFSVSSPTGAVQGTHYTLGGNSVTIPAGEALDSITVTGIYDEYLSGRKDTLIFTIQESGAKASDNNSIFKLALRGPCFEGDVELDELLGAYPNTNETFGTSPYGPYETVISSVTSTGPTTGTIVVENIWDNGWGSISFELDWTDPANRTANVIPKAAISGSDAGDLNSAYAGNTMAVRPFAGQPGTFSYCNGTLTLRMQLGVTGVGFFGSLYTVNMAR